MSHNIEKYIIFISGPSDTLIEKNMAKNIINSIDKVICPKFNMSLESRMGETHHYCGMGRPQDNINPFVLDCDLLLVIFNNIYGTSTGKYRSGTEEELKISIERYQKTKKPEIILLFKDIKRKDLSKYETQISKITKLKKEINEIMLYDKYSNRSDLYIAVLHK